MINRENWKLVNKYLEYRKRVDQMSDKTIRLETTWLNHVLEWADDCSFEKAPGITIPFPAYLPTARKDGKDKPFSKEYARCQLAHVNVPSNFGKNVPPSKI